MNANDITNNYKVMYSDVMRKVTLTSIEAFSIGARY